MKGDIKAGWLENLRSGEYGQVEGALHNAEGYCCLGVLCETMIELGYPVERRDTDSGSHYRLATQPDDETEDEWEMLLPSNRIYKMAGLAPKERSIYVCLDREFANQFPLRVEEESDRIEVLQDEVVDTNYSLDEMNDADFTFIEIADLIERQL